MTCHRSAATLVYCGVTVFEAEFGWGDRDEPGPQTESSIERGYRHREPVDDELGRSYGIDPDNVGDIADEGRGHRG